MALKQKITTIDLEFESPNDYEGTVTLSRKGKVESVTFSMTRNKEPRKDDALRFHFVGDRSQLDELHKFIGRVLQDSFDELHPEEAKRMKAMQEKEIADAPRESWKKP